MAMNHFPKSVQILSFFWYVFPRIWTEYRDLRRKFTYSLQIRENTDQRKLRIWILFVQWTYTSSLGYFEE